MDQAVDGRDPEAAETKRDSAHQTVRDEAEEPKRDGERVAISADVPWSAQHTDVDG